VNCVPSRVWLFTLENIFSPDWIWMFYYDWLVWFIIVKYSLKIPTFQECITISQILAITGPLFTLLFNGKVTWYLWIQNENRLVENIFSPDWIWMFYYDWLFTKTKNVCFVHVGINVCFHTTYLKLRKFSLVKFIPKQ
jgi:hypothetical protein